VCDLHGTFNIEQDPPCATWAEGLRRAASGFGREKATRGEIQLKGVGGFWWDSYTRNRPAELRKLGGCG